MWKKPSTLPTHLNVLGGFLWMRILSQPSSDCNLYTNYEHIFVDMETANNSLNYKDDLGVGPLNVLMQFTLLPEQM